MSTAPAMSRPKKWASGKTGSWRIFRPRIDKDACNACGLCALYCPDAAIGEDLAIDLEYCKGCGICAPLDVQKVSRRREECVTLIDLTYASPMGGRVPAKLVVPGGAGPIAGMLSQHGMPSTRQPMIPIAVNYARMGAVVLLIEHRLPAGRIG